MMKYFTPFIVCILFIGLTASPDAKDNDKPIKFKQLKKMIEEGETTEFIVNEIEERGFDFEMDIKTKGKLSQAGAAADLMLYLNDPGKYWAKVDPGDSAEYGGVTLDIEGSWIYSDDSEAPLALVIYVDGEEIRIRNEWSRILQVSTMDGGSLYSSNYVTKMTLEPGQIDLSPIEAGLREIEIAMVAGYENPSKSRLRSNIIYSQSFTVEKGSNTIIELEAYNDSKGGFKIR